MINSRSNRGRHGLATLCTCCDFVYDKKTAKLAKKTIRRKEKVMWRKDWDL